MIHSEIEKKFPAIYRTSDDISNLKIRVRLRKVGDEIEESRTFSWSEKIYGKYERDFYKNEGNCFSDSDRKHHENVKDLLQTDSILFTYILESNHDLYQEEMQIMADFSDGDYKIRDELLLCSVKYNRDRSLLIVYPDFKNTPYFMQHNDQIYSYFIEDQSEKIPINLQLTENEILERIARKVPKFADFEMPKRDQLKIFINLEILKATDFEYDQIYVQFYVDLPKNFTGNPNQLSGSTTTCKSKNQNGLCHFGSIFEIDIDHTQSGDEKPFSVAPYIYFEAISIDSWGRYRTEGLAYMKLIPVPPGVAQYDLQCFRIKSNGVYSEMRRFFLGDYHNFDFSWLSVQSTNREEKILNKYGASTIGTGTITVRLNTLYQIFDENVQDRTEKNFFQEKLTMSGLVKSVEAVLEAFKRVKLNMIETRSRIEPSVACGSSTD